MKVVDQLHNLSGVLQHQGYLDFFYSFFNKIVHI